MSGNGADSASPPEAPKRAGGWLESLVWLVAAAAVVVYGSGERDLLAVLAQDERVNRTFLALGVINTFLNAVLFLYVYAWLRGVRGVRDPLSSGTLAIPAGAVTFVTTVVSFVVALWPVFGVLSVLQVLVITYGTVSALHFLPGVGPLRPLGGGGGGGEEAAGQQRGERRPRRRRAHRHE